MKKLYIKNQKLCTRIFEAKKKRKKKRGGGEIKTWLGQKSEGSVDFQNMEDIHCNSVQLAISWPNLVGWQFPSNAHPPISRHLHPIPPPPPLLLWKRERQKKKKKKGASFFTFANILISWELSSEFLQMNERARKARNTVTLETEQRKKEQKIEQTYINPKTMNEENISNYRQQSAKLICTRPKSSWLND